MKQGEELSDKGQLGQKCKIIRTVLQGNIGKNISVAQNSEHKCSTAILERAGQGWARALGWEKALAVQAVGPEWDSQNPHGRREPNPECWCSPTSTCAHQGLCVLSPTNKRIDAIL